MAVTMLRQESAPAAPVARSNQNSLLTTSLLADEHRAEALAFLAARPVHTVFMASLIRDNGLVSPRNRGSFYAARERDGKLDGIALIGHATLIEARSEAALSSFARLAQNCSLAHLIRGEHDKIEYFWNQYAAAGSAPRLLCREMLLEQRVPPVLRQYVKGLRRAQLADLEQIAAVNAVMIYEESGVNPLDKDPEGFRGRIARRIEQGRVWVWIEQDELMFKADVVAETPQATYLEGVYVNPCERGKGYGMNCMTQMGRVLLDRTGSLCLTVNEQVRHALGFYLKAGYQLRSYYDTIYLQRHTA